MSQGTSGSVYRLIKKTVKREFAVQDFGKEIQKCTDEAEEADEGAVCRLAVILIGGYLCHIVVIIHILGEYVLVGNVVIIVHNYKAYIFN